MSGQQMPATSFSALLRALYEAAGSPDLATLGRQAENQQPSLKLSDATLSDWFSSKSIPTKEPEFRFLVAFLEGRAVRKNATYVRRGADGWWRLRGRAWRTRRNWGGTTSMGGGGGAATAGDQQGRPSVSGPLLAPRSAYLAQVRQIAPPVLVGREAELQELARFCLDGHAGAYVWWQARPWAGKSALLSTFVLDPPGAVHSRVQVVAFFITARLAAQDTRQAFTAVVGEQLAALTGQQVPAVIDESLREAWLLDLLDQAAQACRQRQMRLVLVVDGLDEDRGVTTGPHARSIAGLLPGVPPAGMRVVVAGRPNPPVPDDVPDWHPLRQPGIIRPLPGSPHARDLQRLGQTELKRLLRGSPVEQDLLGLLTAARGGLSSDDLHELTDAGLLDIEEVLHTVAGRTFTRRSQLRAATDGLLVYLLGHEELDAAARRYLGETRLTGYRDRLHAWADRYRQPGNAGPSWPPSTPEYLSHIPTNLPAVWATLGQPARAEALARSITDPYQRAHALAVVAETIAAADPDRARHLAEQAEAAARSMTDADQPARALSSVARAIAACDPGRSRRLAEQAETVARSITDPYGQAHLLAVVAEAIAAAGDPDRAETVARSITNPYTQVRALTAVARAIAGADPDRARRLLGGVLAVASWQVPLSVLAEHWPQVVLRCVQELSGNERADHRG